MNTLFIASVGKIFPTFKQKLKFLQCERSANLLKFFFFESNYHLSRFSNIHTYMFFGVPRYLIGFGLHQLFAFEGEFVICEHYEAETVKEQKQQK